MTALWVLGVLAALLLLLCLIRVGVLIQFGEKLVVAVRLGFFKIQVLPVRKRPPKHEHEKEPKVTQEKKAEPKKTFPKPTIGDIRDAAKALWKPLKRALYSTCRGVRIDPLDLSLILGGQEDPAAAAKLYGELHGVVWSGMPALERLLVIPHPHIHLDVDFTSEETRVRGTAGVSARIGTLLRIGMTAAIPVLRWLLTYMKKKKQAPVGKDESDGNGKEQPAA